MLAISLLPLLCVAVLATKRTTLDDYVNTCIDDTGPHKSKPSPDAKLTQQCGAWKDRACCDGPTQDKWVNLDWDHCDEKDMSDACKTHFIKENCMYFCSPNLGPWIVAGDSATKRTERFKGLPFCKSNCDKWWNDCKDDYTCTDNWLTGFEWAENGTNLCKEKTCKKFSEYYTDAKSFCEGVWRASYRVVPDS